VRKHLRLGFATPTLQPQRGSILQPSAGRRSRATLGERGKMKTTLKELWLRRAKEKRRRTTAVQDDGAFVAGCRMSRSVLECASPLALWAGREVRCPCASTNAFSADEFVGTVSQGTPNACGATAVPMDLLPIGIRSDEDSNAFNFVHCTRLAPLLIGHRFNDAVKRERSFIVRVNLK
jgi:hypothetical protein